MTPATEQRPSLTDVQSYLTFIGRDRDAQAVARARELLLDFAADLDGYHDKPTVARRNTVRAVAGGQ